MTPRATVVVPTVDGAGRLPRLLDSLARQTVMHEVIVVDNASKQPVKAPDVEVLRLEENRGFAAAVNIAARRAGGDALVLVNDDCVCEPQFVEEVTAALDPASGVVMSAGILLDAARPSLIDTAGMELDATLLVFDYLNGEPVSVLDGPVADPVGPCGAAAAFDRDAFLEAGGFDEVLFAYWEDVDLVLRLRAYGGRCALAKNARGTHEHSATLGSGSWQKNYLVGFGRAYVARKWGVLGPRRLPQALAADLLICFGQAVIDRNLAGARGRLAGFRAAAAGARLPYPDDAPGVRMAETLLARARRRARMRARTATT